MQTGTQYPSLPAPTAEQLREWAHFYGVSTGMAQALASVATFSMPGQAPHQVHFIGGGTGSGKTTRLLQWAKEELVAAHEVGFYGLDEWSSQQHSLWKPWPHSPDQHIYLRQSLDHKLTLVDEPHVSPGSIYLSAGSYGIALYAGTPEFLRGKVAALIRANPWLHDAVVTSEWLVRS